MRTFVMGDIHGAYKALVQCLERSGFDKEKDTLIQLGDVADGWSEVPECVDELLSIKNLVTIRGNHDVWCWNWFTLGQTPMMWTQQGGQATIDAYVRTSQMTDKKHKEFWDKQIDYYLDEKNRLFVHAGFVGTIEESKKSTYNIPNANDLHWDRSLWGNAELGLSENSYEEIFIGHTALQDMLPKNACNIWNLDTGSGWSGKLTIMYVDTHQYWQSDNVKTLYPNELGR